MKKQKEMPKSGQFVAVWVSPFGGCYSAIIRMAEGEMLAYDHFDDSWRRDHTYSAKFFSDFNADFFMKV